MDYIDEFLKTEGPKDFSEQELSKLERAMLRQFVNECLRKPSRLPDAYYPEDKVLFWLDLITKMPSVKKFRNYFSPQLHGAENIPGGGALIISNHNTTCLADVAPLYFGFFEQKRRILSGTAHRIFNRSDLIKTLGGTPGNGCNAKKLLNEGRYVLSCPEGVLGACRPYYQHNQVLPVGGFSPNGLGYLRTAYETSKPIVPVANVGADETVYILGDIKPQVRAFVDFLELRFSIHKYGLGQNLLEFMDEIKVFPFFWNLMPYSSEVDAYVGKPVDVRGMLGENPKKEDFLEANNLVMKTLRNLIDEHY